MDTTNAIHNFGVPPDKLLSDAVQRQYDNICAIKSKELVLHSLGIRTKENELAKEVIEKSGKFQTKVYSLKLLIIFLISMTLMFVRCAINHSYILFINLKRILIYIMKLIPDNYEFQNNASPLKTS